MKINLSAFEGDVLARVLAGEVTTCIQRGGAAELSDDSRMVFATKQHACESILTKLEKSRRRADKKNDVTA